MTYFRQQPSDANEESHEVAGFIGDDVWVVSADFVCGRMHSRFDSFSSHIHEQFCKPFEDHLDLLRVRFREVGRGERNSDIVDASCNFFVGLGTG